MNYEDNTYLLDWNERYSETLLYCFDKKKRKDQQLKGLWIKKNQGDRIFQLNDAIIINVKEPSQPNSLSC